MQMSYQGHCYWQGKFDFSKSPRKIKILSQNCHLKDGMYPRGPLPVTECGFLGCNSLLFLLTKQCPLASEKSLRQQVEDQQRALEEGLPAT